MNFLSKMSALLQENERVTFSKDEFSELEMIFSKQRDNAFFNVREIFSARETSDSMVANELMFSILEHMQSEIGDYPAVEQVEEDNKNEIY